jgi:hypothetical protein
MVFATRPTRLSAGIPDSVRSSRAATPPIRRFLGHAQRYSMMTVCGHTSLRLILLHRDSPFSTPAFLSPLPLRMELSDKLAYEG